MEEIWKSINFSSSLPNPIKDPQKGSGGGGGGAAASAVFPQAPATALSLNSQQRGVESSDRVRSDPQSQSKSHDNGGPDPSFLYSLNSPFDALSPSADPFPAFCKKRPAPENDDSSGDCKHKRMIKNRESAARSRARKQAYATGLEAENKRLLEENARLRRQVQRYRVAAAAQLPKKPTLNRTLTAPF